MLGLTRYPRLTTLQTAMVGFTTIALLSPWISINVTTGGHAGFQPLSTALGIAGRIAQDNQIYELSEQLLEASAASYIGDAGKDLGYAYFAEKLCDIKWRLNKRLEGVNWELKAYEISKRVAGENSRKSINLASCLIEDLYDCGMTVKARDIAERQTKFIDEFDYRYPHLQAYLANIYCELGQFPKSEQCANIVLPRKDSTYILNGMCLANLACALAKRGRYTEAGHYYSLALKNVRFTLQDPLYLNVCLAVVKEKAQNGSISVEEEHRYVSIAKKRLKAKVPFAECLARNVGSLCLQRGNLRDAEWLFNAAVEGSTKTYGAKSPRSLFAQHKLAELYLKQGRLAEAESLAQQTLVARSILLGPLNVETSNTYQLLGEIKEARGKIDEAGSSYWAALEIRQTELGAFEPVTIKSKNDMDRAFSHFLFVCH